MNQTPIDPAIVDNKDRALKHCWCGNEQFVPFGPDYLKCETCGTLVSQRGLASDELLVKDDDSDYYGKQYWLDHQQSQYALPTFHARAREDLPERNLHWLSTLLKYMPPPARVLELGCAHGSFVKLMKQAGYDAAGVEMSPWVVDFARRTFDIDVSVGPVEALSLPEGQLDAIALMDVIEHLPEPAATMSHCLSLLKPNGILLIQMPDFQENLDFDQLVAKNSPFLDQMKKSDEHLFLYSRRSITEFFRRLGAPHIAFEPAIFAHYDSFLVVSREPLVVHAEEAIDASLLASPDGRIVLALLDLKRQLLDVSREQAGSSDLREALQQQYVLSDALRNDANLLQAQLADLRGHFENSEADREARLRVIEQQGAEISALRNEEASLKQRVADIGAQFEASEADREARLRVIEEQGLQLSTARQAETALQAVVSQLTLQLRAAETDRAARLEVIQRQGQEESALHSRVDELLRTLSVLYPERDTARAAFEQAKAATEAAREELHRAEAVLLDLRGEAEAERETMRNLSSTFWFRLGRRIKAI